MTARRRESATFASIPLRGVSLPLGAAPYAFPAREALCACAVASFPEVVLGAAGAAEARGDHARALRERAGNRARRGRARARPRRGRRSFFPGGARDDRFLGCLTKRFRFDIRRVCCCVARGRVARVRPRVSQVEGARCRRAGARADARRRRDGNLPGRACGANARAEDFPEGSAASIAAGSPTTRASSAGRSAVVWAGRRRALRPRAARARASRATKPPTPPIRRRFPVETAAESPDDGAARRVEAREAARARRLAAYAARRAAAMATEPSRLLARPNVRGGLRKRGDHARAPRRSGVLPRTKTRFRQTRAPGVDAAPWARASARP